MRRHSLFLPDHSGGQRHCVLHEPASPLRGSVLHVPAFAEEMNKSRRMTALQAQRLAAAGWAVMQIDPLGCGDSSGDFADATWDRWIDDVVAAQTWLRARAGGPAWLWGLRTGCLLASAAAPRLDTQVNVLFWQPASSGKTALSQFLRLRLGADIVRGSGEGADARQPLDDDAVVEVVGYALSGPLRRGLAAATLGPPPTAGRSDRRAVFLELSQREAPTLMPATARSAQAWRDAGFDVQAAVVAGPAFWQTNEIETAPALLDATTRALAEAPVPA